MFLLAPLTLPSRAPLSLLEVSQRRRHKVTFVYLLTPVAVWRVKEGGKRSAVPRPPPCPVRGPESSKEEQLMAERSEGMIPTGLRTQPGPPGDSSEGRTWQPHRGDHVFWRRLPTYEWQAKVERSLCKHTIPMPSHCEALTQTQVGPRRGPGPEQPCYLHEAKPSRPSFHTAGLSSTPNSLGIWY